MDFHRKHKDVKLQLRVGRRVIETQSRRDRRKFKINRMRQEGKPQGIGNDKRTRNQSEKLT